MTERERRRRRPAVSCILCRRRKIKCNRETPCNNCVKAKNATCAYRDGPPELQGRLTETAGSKTSDVAAPLTPLNSSTGTSSPMPIHPSRSPPTSSGLALSVDGYPPSTAGSHVRHHEAQTQTTAQPELQGFTTTRSSAQSPAPSFTNKPRVETTTVNFAGNFYFHREQRLPNQPQALTHSVTHKTRLFGQSHWVNSVDLVR